MKFLKFLLVTLFFILFSNSAYALNFGIDLNDGGSDLDLPYSQEVTETGYGTVGLNLDAASLAAFNNLSDGDSGTFTGNFDELAAGYLAVVDFGAANYEMTYLLSTDGDFSVDYTYTMADGLVLTNHAFTFDNGVVDFYIDDDREWSGGATPFLSDDGIYYGSDDGTSIATYTLVSGSGTLQASPGVLDSVDLWNLSSAITSGYFFFENGDTDFADIFNAALNIYITMYVNTSNEITGVTKSQFDTEVQDAVDAGLTLSDGTTLFDPTSYDIILGVETDGSLEFGVVPEPGTFLLLGLGLLGFAGIGRRKIKA